MADPVKLVIDVGAPLRPPQERIDAMEQDALTLLRAGRADEAAAVMRTASDASQIPATEQTVPLTTAELAQRDTDIAASDTQLQRARQRATLELRMRRDRWLAQTDAFMLPTAALPVDLPQPVKDALAANRPAWAAFRQSLRDYPSTVTDPLNPPAFPDPPASPPLALT